MFKGAGPLSSPTSFARLSNGAKGINITIWCGAGKVADEGCHFLSLSLHHVHATRPTIRSGADWGRENAVLAGPRERNERKRRRGERRENARCGSCCGNINLFTSSSSSSDVGCCPASCRSGTYVRLSYVLPFLRPFLRQLLIWRKGRLVRSFLLAIGNVPGDSPIPSR